MITYAVPFITGAAVSLLVLGAWYVYSHERESFVAHVPSSETSIAGTTPKQTEPPETTEKNIDASAIVVTPQQAGQTVHVQRATLPTDGWIVVHEEILDGVIGNALGAARKNAGVHESVTVDLLRNTEPHKQYWIALYTDNGDKIFSLQNDVPMLDTQGALLLAHFIATE